MVTGDNIHTARHIAKECGLFDEAQGHVALEVGGGWGDEACLGNIYRVDRLCRVCVHVRLLLCMVRHVLAWWATWTGQALDATHVETCHMRHGTATKQLKVNVMVFAWRAPPPPRHRAPCSAPCLPLSSCRCCPTCVCSRARAPRTSSPWCGCSRARCGTGQYVCVQYQAVHMQHGAVHVHSTGLWLVCDQRRMMT